MHAARRVLLVGVLGPAPVLTGAAAVAWPCDPAPATAAAPRPGGGPDVALAVRCRGRGRPRRRAIAGTAWPPRPVSAPAATAHRPRRPAPARSPGAGPAPRPPGRRRHLGRARRGLRRAGPGHRRPHVYPKAEGALRRSLALARRPNPAALAGLGALANARHDFAAARTGRHRRARRQPVPLEAYGVLADAQTQLGDHRPPPPPSSGCSTCDPASPPRPAPPTTSSSGATVAGATDALDRALRDRRRPRRHGVLPQPARRAGLHRRRPAEALRQYELGLAADPRPRALLRAGPGRAGRPSAGSTQAIRPTGGRRPACPQPALPAGVRRAAAGAGRTGPAPEQSGCWPTPGGSPRPTAAVDDLSRPQYAADHGEPGRAAVRTRTAEWSRRRSVLVADALGWALHAAGRDAEALRYARAARAAAGATPLPRTTSG